MRIETRRLTLFSPRPPGSHAFAEDRAGKAPPAGPPQGPPGSQRMLRPTFPGGVPYPPRPGEQGARYVFPPTAGPPGAGAAYRDATGQVFVRQPVGDTSRSPS